MSVKTLTVLCTVSLILATFSHSQTLPTQSRTAKIWSDETTDENGDVSRDGRFLSFNNWATSDLAIRDLQTGTNRIITHKTSMEGGQYPGNSFFLLTENRSRTVGIQNPVFSFALSQWKGVLQP